MIFFTSLKNQKLDFFQWVTVAIFFVSVLYLAASLLGVFNIWLILFSLAFFFLAFIYCFKYFDFKKWQYLFFIFVPLVLVGFLLFKGFISGDAYVFWFPWAKIIAQTGKMPIFFDTSGWIFVSSDQPLFLVWLALIMKLFPNQDNLTLIIPLFFNILTFLLIYRWLEKRGLPKIYLIFSVLLLFCNPLLAKYGWDILQESLILFFFTLFFYFYDLSLKDQSVKNQAFLFAAASLAMLTKISGFFLIIPLFYCFFKFKWYRQKSFYLLFLLFLPPLFWLGRNYLILGNPIFPIASQIFQGPYASTVELYVKYLPHNVPGHNITFWFIFIQILIAFPVFLASLAGLIKEKRWEILVMLLAIFSLEANLSIAIPGSMRHNYALLGLLLFYGLIGLKKIESRLFLTLILFFTNYTLLSIPLVKSESQFLAPIEDKLNIFYLLASKLNSQVLFWSVAFSLFFYFLISKNKYRKILLLTIFCLSLLNLSVIEISWLNIYGFIILFLLVFLLSPWLAKEKIKINLNFILISLVILILLVNSWGLALTYYLAHRQFIFPKPEAFEPAMSLAQNIKKVEKDNTNFYILNDSPAVLGWFLNYKEISIDNLTFHYLTKSEYSDSFTAEQFHDFLKKYNIKYVMKMTDNQMMVEMYQKVENHPEFFTLLEKQDQAYLWQVN